MNGTRGWMIGAIVIGAGGLMTSNVRAGETAERNDLPDAVAKARRPSRPRS